VRKLSASEERELKAIEELLERMVVSRLDSIIQRMDRIEADIEEFRSPIERWKKQGRAVGQREKA
jgi:hypothetical protein